MRPAAFETNLAALSCHSIASSPYRPQTCGKIERFWQTLKKWLRARETSHRPYRTLTARNRDLAVFAKHYNARRPHRALGGRTPAAAYAATVNGRPAERPLPSQVQTYRCHVSTGGTISVSGPPGAVALNCASTSAAATNICPSPSSKTASESPSSAAMNSSAHSTSTHEDLPATAP